MISASEMKSGQNGAQLALAPVSDGMALRRAAAQERVSPAVIHLTVSEVLVGLGVGVSAIGLFLWAFVRLWLFAP